PLRTNAMPVRAVMTKTASKGNSSHDSVSLSRNRVESASPRYPKQRMSRLAPASFVHAPLLARALLRRETSCRPATNTISPEAKKRLLASHRLENNTILVVAAEENHPAGDIVFVVIPQTAAPRKVQRKPAVFRR